MDISLKINNVKKIQNKCAISFQMIENLELYLHALKDVEQQFEITKDQNI